MSKINGFILPSKIDAFKLEIGQLAGYLSRKSHVFVELINPKKKTIIDHYHANNLYMSWAKNIFGENSETFALLRTYKLKIENPSDYILQEGRKLINNYNIDDYCLNPITYNNKQQFCLIKLEQLFFQNKLPTCYLEELAKPNETIISGRNAFNWIESITALNHENINLLKQYLEAYFQYLFDTPKSIWCINNLNLPISKFDRRQIIYISQYAGYLNRKSTVIISSITNQRRSITSIEANESFMTWFSSIYGKNSKESIVLNTYRSKIENLSESIINLGSELDNNYSNEKIYTEKQQCLINLEQFLIRYNLPSGYIYNVKSKENNFNNNIVMEWIYKIIKGNDNKKLNKINNKKLNLLNDYLDNYFKYIFDCSKDKEDLKANNFSLSESNTIRKTSFNDYYI